MAVQLAYRNGDDDERDIHGAGVEEGASVGNIDARARTPLSHFD